MVSVNDTALISSSPNTSIGTGESVTDRGAPRAPVTTTVSWTASASSASWATAPVDKTAPAMAAMLTVNENFLLNVMNEPLGELGRPSGPTSPSSDPYRDRTGLCFQSPTGMTASKIVRRCY